MGAWVQCTNCTGGRVYVNLDNANTLVRNDSNNGTWIKFRGGDRELMVVQEEPEQLVQATQGAFNR
jgi:hypothetical protein